MCTAVVTKSSAFTPISTIYPHHELHLQTLEIPHCIRRCLWAQKSNPMQHCDAHLSPVNDCNINFFKWHSKEITLFEWWYSYTKWQDSKKRQSLHWNQKRFIHMYRRQNKPSERKTALLYICGFSHATKTTTNHSRWDRDLGSLLSRSENIATLR